MTRIKATVCMYIRSNFTRMKVFTSQVMAEARPMTKVTAMPMPTAVSTFLDTPRKGQMPKNWEKIKLLDKIAPSEIASRLKIVSIICSPPYSFSAGSGPTASGR